MKTIYICRMGEDWNSDYATAFETLEGVADEIFERAKEEDLFPMITKKELVEDMKHRKNKGFIQLFMPDEKDEDLESFQMQTEFFVQAILLNK